MNCYRCSYALIEGMARCSSCGYWNFKEGPNDITKAKDQSVLLSDVKASAQVRLQSGPWDELCLNGGFVNTSVTLFGAVAGAGKSTICLQIADKFSDQTKREILYVSAEQANEEVRTLAQRLRLRHLNKIRLYSAMGVDDVQDTMIDLEALVEGTRPCAVFLDSLPGLVLHDIKASIEVCQWAKRLAVESKAPVIIIDHIVKSDDFAGLMRLRHEVDMLLTMSVNKKTGIRTLSVVKNRNGPAPLSMKLVMVGDGMKALIEKKEDEEEHGRYPSR
jgi:DNA repair protein RadA/Sms